MRHAALTSLALLALVGCSEGVRLDISGQRVGFGDIERKQNLKGQQVVDMFDVQPSPLWESWLQEIKERMTMGGEQVASKLCGGPAELVSVSRSPFAARSASLRYRCL